MIKVAIYARYSSDQQKETSLDDQIRRCHEVAARHELTVDPQLIYSDAAMSGMDKHTAKRDNYQRLLTDLRANTIDVLIVDEFNRLTRDVVEQANLTRMFESNFRIRMLTADGIDTRNQNWQLQAGLAGLIGQQSGRDTKHRVIRGMLGQLERGFMIAAPAFGYSLNRIFEANTHVGTQWVIHEENAAIVRKIFEDRSNGQSMHQIAKGLNDQGIPTVRASRIVGGGFWRPARIKNILANPIYRGEFRWNDSTNVKAKAAKSGKPVEMKAFARPELRLVSDDLWHQCNANKISRSGYGGGKNALAGLIRCDHCHSILFITSKTRCRSAYCSACTNARAMKDDPDALTSTIAVDGINLLLQEALKTFITPEVVETFRRRLRDKLTGSLENEIAQEKENVARLLKSQERLSEMLARYEEEDAVLLKRYEEARDLHKLAESKLTALVQSTQHVDVESINRQLAISPLELLPKLFESKDIDPARLRSVLARLFPEIVFEGKTTRYNALFRIRFSIGAAASLCSNTPPLEGTHIERRFHLSYHPGSWGNAAYWSVDQL